MFHETRGYSSIMETRVYISTMEIVQITTDTYADSKTSSKIIYRSKMLKIRYTNNLRNTM